MPLSPSTDNHVFKCVAAGIWRYIVTELTHGYELNENEQVYSEKQRRVSTFMKTPRELEKVGILLYSDFSSWNEFHSSVPNS